MLAFIKWPANETFLKVNVSCWTMCVCMCVLVHNNVLICVSACMHACMYCIAEKFQGLPFMRIWRCFCLTSKILSLNSKTDNYFAITIQQLVSPCMYMQ